MVLPEQFVLVFEEDSSEVESRTVVTAKDARGNTCYDTFVDLENSVLFHPKPRPITGTNQALGGSRSYIDVFQQSIGTHSLNRHYEVRSVRRILIKSSETDSLISTSTHGTTQTPRLPPTVKTVVVERSAGQLHY
jgi:hypothetical protein